MTPQSLAVPPEESDSRYSNPRNVRTFFSRLPFTRSALILTALKHATAVKLARRNVFRYLLDNLSLDPAPKAIDKIFAIWHVEKSHFQSRSACRTDVCQGGVVCGIMGLFCDGSTGDSIAFRSGSRINPDHRA